MIFFFLTGDAYPSPRGDVTGTWANVQAIRGGRQM